jgi:hypothetical protein
MRAISPCVIESDDIADLVSRQGEIDAATSFEQAVALAKERFDQKPRALFSRVRLALAVTSGDLIRCGYCEDSCADEVEHVWPKIFFPGRTFDPGNYLYACGICNPAKRDKFNVRYSGQWLDLTAHRKANGWIAPPDGTARFIDPLTEQPMDLLWLDIAAKSFRLVPIFDEGTVEYERAEFTINALRLNREVIVEARRNAYSGFVDRIAAYFSDKVRGASQAVLDSRLFELRRSPHQTVRLEIARQVSATSLDQDLVASYPEVLN